jgi:methyl-accepting chemotaxis protein
MNKIVDFFKAMQAGEAGKARGARGILFPLGAALLLAAFAAVVRLSGTQGVAELPLFGMAALLVVFASALAAANRRQALAVLLLALAALTILLVADVLPAKEGAFAAADLALVAATAVVLALGGLLSLFAVSMRTAVAEANRAEAESVRRRFELARASIVKAQKGAYETGLDISKAVEKTIAAVHRLEGLVSGTADGIDVLNGALNDTASSNDRIVESQGLVRSVLSSYSREVAEESTAVQAMAGAVTSVADSSRKKRQLVENLLGLSSGAESKLASIRLAVDRMVQSAGKVGEMNSLITEVADRTNLLAMNASIEAAHAGQAGKGFAVIAGQVRALSVEAANGSRAISATLKETNSSISETALAADEAIRFFRSVSTEIKGIAAMLEELLAGMQSMSSGATSLLESVKRVESLNASTKEAVDTSETSIVRAQSSIKTVMELVKTIQSDSTSMMKAFGEMRAIAETVGSLGVHNMDHIEVLKKELIAE